MMNYKKMYFELFNALTDAVWQIELGQVAAARKTLIKAQQNTEEMYLTESDDESPDNGSMSIVGVEVKPEYYRIELGRELQLNFCPQIVRHSMDKYI